MVEKKLTSKSISINNRAENQVYFEDKNDLIDTTGVTVDDVAYDTGGFLDRDYDVRLFKNLSMQIKNTGANSIDITVLGTTKDFDALSDLADGDFTETELTEVAVVATAISAIYNLDRTPSGKPAITAVRLRAKETTVALPGEVTAAIKGL